MVKLRLCPDQDAQVKVSGANFPPQPASEKAEDIREASAGLLGWRRRPPSVTGDWPRPPNLRHHDGIDQATQCQSGKVPYLILLTVECQKILYIKGLRPKRFG